MTKIKSRIISLCLAAAILLSAAIAVTPVALAAGEGITASGGWFESAYAEWSAISGADSYNAYIAKGTDAWAKLDPSLIRSTSGGYRVDAVGLTIGEYRIRVVPVSGGAEDTDAALTTGALTVTAYDRSGYAHFNYTDGVGAYNDDGSLKEGAIVLYVTEATKDTVTVTSKDGTTVTGIGNILNSVGKDVGGGKSSKGGLANTNEDILRKLAADGTPLVVRIIGRVSAPSGLTAYDSVDYGGSVGDNGFMARMSGGKDITVEGIGTDAVMDGWGLHFICQTGDYSSGYGRSFEVRNIAFKNVPEDCVGMEGQQDDSTLTAPVERCWIHHCSFYAPVIANPAESDKDGGDGACDFKRGQYFTNSYCYYVGYHKTNLVGSSDTSLQYHLTYHHNYWKDCESRGPLARQANIHMYNNIFEGQTSYCMNPRANAYIFSEYNLFLKSKNPVDVKSGAVKSYGDSFTSCTGNNHATVVTDRATAVTSGNKYGDFDTNPALSYIPAGDYVIEEDITRMKAVVLAYAGTQKAGNVTPDTVNTSAIPTDRYPTAAVVLDYTKTLNKTTVPSAGVYDNIVYNTTKLGDDYISVGGSANGADIVFYVDTAVNITITQHAESTVDAVICDESGRSLLVGGGTVENLPHGYYFIQSNIYDVGSGKFKEAKITSLTVLAVDKNAATNPIPTPPTGGTDTPDTPDTPGTTPGGSVTEGTVITPDSEVHSFTDNDKVDPEGFFSITGNTSTSKGSVTFNGQTLTKCLKIESSTRISFTAKGDGTLVLVFGGTTNAAGQEIKIDGVSQVIPSNQILEFTLSAGSHTVTKDNSINLFYMAFVPAGASHTHDYTATETTAPTCTEKGIMTYTCSCGDSYTEDIDPKGHNHRVIVTDPTCTEDGAAFYECDCGDSYTEKIGAIGHSYDAEETTAPTCTEKGVTTYTCHCGDTYTEDIDPKGHSYSDGACVNCGAADPDAPTDDPTNNPGTGDDPTDDPTDNPGTGDDPTDDPTDNPGTGDDPTDNPTDNPGTGDDPTDDPTDNPGGNEGEGNGDDEPEEKLNFFQRIWRAIVNFFKNLFGKKKK